jgi:hypothetical protein
VDTVRLALEADSAFWFGLVKDSGYAVAIGCLLEAPETFVTIKRWWRLRSRGEDHEETREDRGSPIIPIAAVGLIIIVIGIVAETYFEGKVSDVDALLRAHESDKITAAENEAAVATKNAGSAAVNAGLAQDSADNADDDAKDANDKAVAVEGKAKTLAVQLRSAETQLATVETKRAKLEKSLENMAICNASRVIGTWMNTRGKTSVDSLLPMRGQKVFIEVVKDAEARRAARNLHNALVFAKWDVPPVRLIDDDLEDGVSVQPSVAGRDPTKPYDNEASVANMNASEVGGKLVDFLHSYNWQATRGNPLDASRKKMLRDPAILPEGAIRVQIGLYPPVQFVSPPGDKETALVREQFRQMREKEYADDARREEEDLKNFPPEQREARRKRDAQSQADWKAEQAIRDNSTYPCQVLEQAP